MITHFIFFKFDAETVGSIAESTVRLLENNRIVEYALFKNLDNSSTIMKLSKKDNIFALTDNKRFILIDDSVLYKVYQFVKNHNLTDNVVVAFNASTGQYVLSPNPF